MLMIDIKIKIQLRIVANPYIPLALPTGYVEPVVLLSQN